MAATRRSTSARARAIPRSRFFSVPYAPLDGDRTIRLHALEWGPSDASPLLLLHGGGAHAHWWDHVAPRFSTAHRAIALDFRGHGDSERSPVAYGTRALVGDVEAVIDELGGEADVVGASMGGHVAIRVAARSRRVRRLVIADAPPAPPQSVAESRVAMSRPKRYRTRDEALRRFRLMPPGTSAAPEILEYVARHSIRPEGDGWTVKFDLAIFATPPPDALWEVLPSLRCRVLILRGERSELVPAEAAEAMAGVISGARLVTIAGAHHHLHLDAPDRFAEVVRAFLADGTAPADRPQA